MPVLDEKFCQKRRGEVLQEFSGCSRDNRPLAREASDRYQKFIEYAMTPTYRHWTLYKKNIPLSRFMARAVGEKRREYLDETNSVELGETSSILRRIIGDSDTPFIYETRYISRPFPY